MKKSDLFKTAYAEFWDITESRRLVPKLLVEEYLDYNEYESEATEFIYNQQEQAFTENLNGKSSFILATKEFRNRRQHRLPPRLSFGTTATVKRTFLEDNSIQYGFGYEKPLIFNEVLPELVSQAKLMRVAFQNYWKLVQEHCGEMNTSLPLP